MSYRFAVCDDDAEYARYIDGLAARWAKQAGTQLETERFPSAEAFLFRYEERRDFDVLPLDIEMTGMDGVELAKTVRQAGDDVQIVFITGYTDYIARATRYPRGAGGGGAGRSYCHTRAFSVHSFPRNQAARKGSWV